MEHNHSIYKNRRNKLIRNLHSNSLVIIPNKNLSIRSNDVEYKFKPDSSFYYLTGFDEPSSICVLKKEKKSYTYILFVEPQNKEKEIWVGKNAGLEGAKRKYKAQKSFAISDFDKQIKSLIQESEYIYYPIGQNKKLESKITSTINQLKKSNRGGNKSPKGLCDSSSLINKMRLIKDNYEIKCMQEAANITKEAHILAMSCGKPKVFEYELEAAIEYIFKCRGSNGPAYPSIVGSGDNTTILHYIKNNKKIKKDDLILIDAGCEYNYYASDVTRTFPANKKFTKPQKEIYEIVLKAQLEAIKQAKPGKSFIDVHNKAVKIIVEGLKSLKLLKGSTEKLIKKGEYKKFYMHQTSHWLGLDVHDAGPYKDEKGKSIKLAPNMVMTIEPGIYISRDMKGVPKKYRGIGIRIEDDILITKNGNKVLSTGIPKTVEEIEILRA